MKAIHPLGCSRVGAVPPDDTPIWRRGKHGQFRCRRRMMCDDLKSLDGVHRHGLEPNSLPDAREVRVVPTIGLARWMLFAARLGGIQGIIEHSNNDVVFDVVGEQFGDVERAGCVASLVLARLLAVDPNCRLEFGGTRLVDNVSCLRCPISATGAHRGQVSCATSRANETIVLECQCRPRRMRSPTPRSGSSTGHGATVVAGILAVARPMYWRSTNWGTIVPPRAQESGNDVSCGVFYCPPLPNQTRDVSVSGGGTQPGDDVNLIRAPHLYVLSIQLAT